MKKQLLLRSAEVNDWLVHIAAVSGRVLWGFIQLYWFSECMVSAAITLQKTTRNYPLICRTNTQIENFIPLNDLDDWELKLCTINTQTNFFFLQFYVHCPSTRPSFWLIKKVDYPFHEGEVLHCMSYSWSIQASICYQTLRLPDFELCRLFDLLLFTIVQSVSLVWGVSSCWGLPQHPTMLHWYCILQEPEIYFQKKKAPESCLPPWQMQPVGWSLPQWDLRSRARVLVASQSPLWCTGQLLSAPASSTFSSEGLSALRAALLVTRPPLIGTSWKVPVSLLRISYFNLTLV